MRYGVDARDGEGNRIKQTKRRVSKVSVGAWVNVVSEARGLNEVWEGENNREAGMEMEGKKEVGLCTAHAFT